MIVTILDRHIGRVVLYSTLLVFAVLLALFTLFEFVDKLDELGHGSFGLYQALKYLVLTLPRKIYELFPMAALLGTILGMSSLAMDSELIAMRAAGVSLLRIVGSVAKIGAVFVLAAVLIGEFGAPAAEKAATRSRAEAMNVGIQQENASIWLRDDLAFINIGEVLPDLSVLRLYIYQFDASDQLRLQTFAESARYEDGKWRLREVSQSLLDQDRVQIRSQSEEEWVSSIDPEVLAVFAVKPESLSAFNLYRYIRHLARNSQETERYRLALWYKLIAPLTTGVMVVLAIPFVFMSTRGGGLGSRLFVGIMLGLAFFVLNRAFGFAALLYNLPPFLGALAPTLLFFLLALYLLRRVA